VGYSATALAITTLLGGFVIASEKVEVKIILGSFVIVF
jgi:hypothetical protein